MKITNGFIVKLGLYSLVILLLFYFAEPHLPAKVMYPNHLYIQLLLIIITWLFHLGLMRAAKQSDQAFIRFFMGATGGKLFLLMVLMILYGLVNRETAFAFILHLFVYYLLYTVFEVAVVYRKFSGMKRVS